MSSIDSILAKAKPATAAVKLCVDGSLMADIDLLNDELAEYAEWTQGSLSDKDPRTDIRKRLDDLREQARQDDRSQVFRFRSLGDIEWSDLLAAHPPRPDVEDEVRWNSTTFPAALVAASAVDPELTVADVEKLWGIFNAWQRDTLFTTAYSANMRGVDIPFSPASSGEEASTGKN